MNSNIDRANYILLTADIVSAYVSNNVISVEDLNGLIQSTFAAPTGLSDPSAIVIVENKQKPAVSIKKSISDDYIICLEDGRKFKSLKRHLRTKYNMSPDQYRAKWGLPKDYPMTAPSYAERRSNLAKAAGLGRVPRDAQRSKIEAAPKKGRALKG
jgi:predicted transcriptional regulator